MKNRIINSDCLSGLKTLPEKSVNCCVTSPPYFRLRDYGVAGQMGLEATPQDFVASLVAVFREVKRVLSDDGTLWLNLGDSYAGSGKGAWDNKNGGQKDVYIPNPDSPQCRIQKIPTGIKAKDLIGIPWRAAFALQADGWYLRQDIIWAKPNPMPESVTDRCTKGHEYIFMLTKSPKYYYDARAIMEPAKFGAEHAAKSTSWGTNRKHPNKANVADYAFKGANHTCHLDKQRGHSRRHAGFNDRWNKMPKKEQCGYLRNKRDVWTVATKPYKEAHFATFPPELIRPCILAGCPGPLTESCPDCTTKTPTESKRWFRENCPTCGGRGVVRRTGLVLDPFMGAGTTAVVAKEEGRDYVGFELNPAYIKLAEKRIAKTEGWLDGLI